MNYLIRVVLIIGFIIFLCILTAGLAAESVLHKGTPTSSWTESLRSTSLSSKIASF